MKFQDKIIAQISKKNSVLIVGLDPNLDLFPEFIIDKGIDDESIATAIFEFNKLIIDCVHDKCIAVKPQLAYYEVFGSYGIQALENTIAYAKTKDLIVINDAKRGDIGSTCEAYAKAFLSDTKLSGDALTVNPYLGSDGILPFIKVANEYNKGIFVLVKTSNPSSSELQNIHTKDGTEIYIRVANLVKDMITNTKECSTYSNIGVVVGGTYPKEAILVRELLNQSFFLVPGYGAQGASGKVLVNYFDNNGLGALVSSSRGITYPYLYNKEYTKDTISKEQFINMVIQGVESANKDINKYRFTK